MTTTAAAVVSDDLAQAADQVAAKVDGTETPVVEPPAPSYVTSEDVTRLITEADDRSSRRWQGIADQQIAAANRKADERVDQLRRDMELKDRKQEEAGILALPEEEQAGAWARLAYNRANEAKDAATSPQTVAPRDAVAITETQNEAMVSRVTAQAQDIASQAGTTVYDMRLWNGTNTNLNEQENLDIIRRNADAIKPQTPAPTNGVAETVPTQATPPQPQARQPEPVPIRPSPAAAAGAQTDQEIERAVIDKPQNPAAHKAYADMMLRRRQE